MAKEINASQFETSVRNANGVALVDFWAPWCGPCQIVGPIIEQVGTEMEGQASVYKVNVDENPELAGGFGIRSIPTVMIFKDGEPVEQIVGVRDKGTYVRSLNQYLSE